MLIANQKGSYSFLRGIAPYSGGVVADEGYEIVHARFLQALSLEQGFARIRAELEAKGRPLQALCGVELRSPEPFTFAGFSEFNAGYVETLRDWDLLVDGANPVARTNVAPEVGAPRQPSIYGFSYTVASAGAGRTFVVAGGGELPEGSLSPEDVVRLEDTSFEGIREKARFVMELMSGRVRGLGVSWDLATTVNVYTIHEVGGILGDIILKPMGASAIHGINWHFSRPPILTIEYEMDLRGCRRDIVLAD